MKAHKLISLTALLFVAVHGKGEIEDKKEHKSFSREIEDLLHASEDLFFGLTNRFDASFSPSKWFDHYTFTSRPASTLSPKYQIVDDDKMFKVTYQNLQVYDIADVSIDLSYEGRILDIHGEHKTERDDKEGRHSSSKRNFHHIFKLHPNSDVDSIIANMTPDGKLVVEVPKLDNPRSVRSKVPIQIKMNEKAGISQ